MSNSYKIDKLPEHSSVVDGDYVIGVCDGIVTKIPRSQLRGVRGPKGPTGFAGLDGYQGQKGPQGDAGPAGDKGPAGADGDKGPQGDAGANGAPGSEITTPEVINSDTWAMTFFEDEPLGASTWATGKGWTDAGSVSAGTIAARDEWSVTDPIVERRLVIPDTGGELLRRMPWRHYWNRLQIAVAWRVDGTSNFNGEWALGICSGAANPFSSASCANFVGAHSGATGTFTYNSVANVWLTDYYQGAGSVAFVNKVNNTITSATVAVDHVISATEERLSMIGFSVWRPLFAGASAVTYTSRIWLPEPTNQIDYASSNWLTQQNCFGFFSETTSNWVQAQADNDSFSHSEATGVLDTVNLWWEGGEPLEIAAITVRKIY